MSRPAGEDVGRGPVGVGRGYVGPAGRSWRHGLFGNGDCQSNSQSGGGDPGHRGRVGADGCGFGGGKIYDSNSFTVTASVIACGGIPKPLGIAKDDLGDLHRKLEAATGSDLVITSAGVSKGDYDIVKDVLTQRGDMNFWSVRMRPAKPLAFGHLKSDNGKTVPLLGLPGNPVSAMVAFEMFARPAIRTMLGRKRLPRPTVEGVLTGPIHNADGRRVYARVEVRWRNGTYYAKPAGPQGSNILTSMARANGLAICPENLSSKKSGRKGLDYYVGLE